MNPKNKTNLVIINLLKGKAERTMRSGFLEVRVATIDGNFLAVNKSRFV